VNVHDIGAKLLQDTSNAPAHFGRSGKLVDRSADLRQDAMDRVVVRLESFNFYAPAFEQAGLCVHHGVFSAALLIPVVD
jgi:hypothetical protein